MIAEGHATDDDTTVHRGRLVWREGAAIRHPDDDAPGPGGGCCSSSSPSPRRSRTGSTSTSSSAPSRSRPVERLRSWRHGLPRRPAGPERVGDHAGPRGQRVLRGLSGRVRPTTSTLGDRHRRSGTPSVSCGTIRSRNTPIERSDGAEQPATDVLAQLADGVAALLEHHGGRSRPWTARPQRSKPSVLSARSHIGSPTNVSAPSDTTTTAGSNASIASRARSSRRGTRRRPRPRRAAG